MQFGVLGPLEVTDQGFVVPLGGRRQRTVLAVLLLNANGVVSGDRLIDEVWGDYPPSTARKSLQAYVSRLRGLLGDGVLEPSPPGYVLRVDSRHFDAERFAELAHRGRESMETDPALAAASLREALGMWRGGPFADLADEPSLRSAITRLEDQRLAAVEDRIEADLRLGRHGHLVGELESLIDRHPLRERLRGQLMLALYRSGRQAEALRAYQETRQNLAEELGIEPSPELQRLEERILSQDPGLGLIGETAVEVAEAVPNPYKGLRAFGEGDAVDFHGREGLVEEMVGLFEQSRFLAVVGPSGSGKSSVVRAGLIPRLKSGALEGSEAWCYTPMLPGAHPFEELEAALIHACSTPLDGLREQFRGDDLDLLRAVLRVTPGDRSELVLVIDQFEELFLLVDEEVVRQRFIRNVIEALEDPHSRFRVVVTLRADFFDRPLEYPELATWIGRNHVAVPPLGPGELERAAVRPAARVGIGFELDLASEMVSDVASQPGALPLFQYTLTELFDRRAGSTLTLDVYRAFGGLNGALRNRAEEIFASLNTAQQATARQAFLRLVTLGEGANDTRRRVRRTELDGLETGEGTVAAVLDAFGAYRLLSFDRDSTTAEPTVELAHEALLTEWPRFSNWIDTSREDLRAQRALIAASAEWQAASFEADYLLTGTRLALFEQWSGETSVLLTSTEREYLDAGLRRRSEGEAAETARRRREIELERRSVSRLRVLVAVLAIAALGAAALTTVAVNRSREADRLAAVEQEQRLLAEQREDEANLSTVRLRAAEMTAASVASLQDDPQLSLLLALHAVEIMNILEEPIPTDTVTALHWAVQAAGIPYPSGGEPGIAVPGPNGMQGLYDLPLDDLVVLAQGGLTRSLNGEECARFLSSTTCGPLPATFPPLQPAGTASTPEDPERPLAGTNVLVMGAITGLEAEGFRAEMRRFAELTGIEVSYLGLGDLEDRLAELKAAARPDLAFIAQPGAVIGAARDGVVMDLANWLDPVEAADDYSPYLVRLLTVGDDGSWPSASGSLYGIPLRLSVKSLIWYPVPEFEQAGYELPRTWGDLIALSDRMVADRRTPWCWGEWNGPASGWPATDWIEDILLHEAGVEVYDRWVAGDLPFQSAPVRSAFEHLGEIVFHDDYLAGDLARAISLPVWLAQETMFEDPPECWLYRQASNVPQWFPFGIAPGVDAKAIPFPTMGTEPVNVVLGAGDLVMAYRDRPEVRELIHFINQPEFGAEWVKILPTFLSAHRRFDPANYILCNEPEKCEPDLEAQAYGAQIALALEADAFRFDGSDLMDGGGSWMWTGMLDYLKGGPDSLDQVLANLDDEGWRSTS